jgi:hypothetical protein
MMLLRSSGVDKTLPVERPLHLNNDTYDIHEGDLDKL